MIILFQEHGAAVIAVIVIIALIAILGIILATNGPAYHAFMNMINFVLTKAGIGTVS